jgi:hypothetical protein
LSPDGRTLAVLLRGTAVLYDLEAGRKLRRLDGLLGSPSLAFSPDGRWVVQPWPELQLIETATGAVRLKVPRATATLATAALAPDSRLLALTEGPEVLLWDTAAGKQVAKLVGHQGTVGALTFTADGKSLATGSADGTALVWDVTAARKQIPAAAWPADGVSPWDDLASQDAGVAHRAVWALADNPGKAEALLKARVKAGAGVTDRQIANLIADLDADDFPVREAASKKLALLGPVAVPALEKALEGKPSAEVRRRVKALLEDNNEKGYDPERARTARALEALERLGTAEAKAVLEELAKGPADLWETADAKRALDRLKAASR